MSFLVTIIGQKTIQWGILLREANVLDHFLLSTDLGRAVSHFPLNPISPDLLSIERPLFNINWVYSLLAAKFVRISKQWEVYLGYELLGQHIIVNRDLILQWIDKNVEFDTDSVSNVTGKQPSIEQL